MHGVLRQMGILLDDYLYKGETVNAGCYCKNCNGSFTACGVGCLVLVLSCCTIMLGHTRLDGQYVCCRSSAGRCSIIHPLVRTTPPVIYTFFLHLKKFLSYQHQFSEWQRGRDECHAVFAILGGWLIWHRIAKVWSHGMTNLNSGGEYV